MNILYHSLNHGVIACLATWVCLTLLSKGSEEVRKEEVCYRDTLAFENYLYVYM